MRNLLILLTIVVFTLACSTKSVNTRTDLELSNLHGPVWKVDRTNHSSSAGCVCPAAEKNECNQSLVVYNEKGNIAESFDIDANGDTMVHSVYKYNKRGICTGIDKFKGNRLSGKEIPDFENGKLSQVKIIDEYGNHTLTYYYKYSGDEVSEITTVKADGEQVSRTSNEYQDGRLISQTKSNKDGKILSTTLFKRNDQNDIAESVITLSTDTATYTMVFEYQYDDQGNWIKQTKYYNCDIESVVLRNITYYESDASLVTEKL